MRRNRLLKALNNASSCSFLDLFEVFSLEMIVRDGFKFLITFAFHKSLKLQSTNLLRMQAIILLAGQGSRMGDLTKNNHKSLLPLNANETFLSRLLHQLNEYYFSKVIVVTGHQDQLIKDELSNYQLNFEVVHNDKYLEDTNIYSMSLALDQVSDDEPVIILEGDIWLNDLALKTIYEESVKGTSLWFVKGHFKAPQYGGILKADDKNNIVDLKLVKSYDDKYEDYHKLIGIMSISPDNIKFYKTLIFDSIKKSIDQYYLVPWIDNLEKLPCKSVSLENFKTESVNTEKEYRLLVKELNDSSQIKIEFCNVADLLPIENFIPERFDLLYDSIKNSSKWIRPIVVDKKHHLILDGHHRFEVAKKMGLKTIPAILVNYSDIEIWSLRPDQIVNHELVISKALKGDIYPNKTVKHSFPFQVLECSVDINSLY